MSHDLILIVLPLGDTSNVIFKRHKILSLLPLLIPSLLPHLILRFFNACEFPCYIVGQLI